MSASSSELLVRYRREAATVRAEFCVPVLVWEARGRAHGEMWEHTSALGSRTPTLGDPRVLRVRKAEHSDNAFALGITVGRVDSNDLVLVDDSVSRFHAFFQLDPLTRGWTLCDAESRNGTWVAEARLAPGVKAPVPDGAAVRFGDTTTRFMLPATFFAWLLQRP